MADSVTFFGKEEIQCPVCEEKFYKETLRTGRGRLIAGDLTRELRRLYEATEKYGEVYPLVYSITVCPECRYATFPGDFTEIPEGTVRKLSETAENRMH